MVNLQVVPASPESISPVFDSAPVLVGDTLVSAHMANMMNFYANTDALSREALQLNIAIMQSKTQTTDKSKEKDKSGDAGKSRIELVKEGKLPIYVLTPSEAKKLGGFKPPR